MSESKQHRSASDDANDFSYRKRTEPSSTLCGQELGDEWFAGVAGGAKPRRRAWHLPMVLALKPYGENIRRSKPCDFRRSKPCDADLVHAFVCSSTASKALSQCAFFFSLQGDRFSSMPWRCGDVARQGCDVAPSLGRPWRERCSDIARGPSDVARPPRARENIAGTAAPHRTTS